MAWADLSDVRAWYELLGEGEPLVLVPGLGCTCRHWDDVAADLAAHFTLVMPDNRGMGRSVPRRNASSLADLAVDVVELLDHLQLERAHVLGLSLGGVIAQRVAMDFPDRVDRLVLVSCAERFSPYLRQVIGLLGQTLRRMPREAFVRTMELLGTAPQYLDAHADVVERRIADKCRCGPPARDLARQLRCIAHSEVEPQRFRIDSPTLVMSGEHDALIPHCYAREMADRISGSRFVLLRGAGHNPLMDDPERAVPLIVRFLKGTLGHDADERNGRTTERWKEPMHA
jgi:pimeloyl-ACP methyl ester carboxylesterase